MKRKIKRTVIEHFKNPIHEIIVIKSVLNDVTPARFVVTFITKHHFVGLTEVKACIQGKVFHRRDRALSQAFKWLSEINNEYTRNGRK